MRTFVINLDRSEDRLRAFRAANSNLEIERFPAVDGAKQKDLRGIIAPGLQYSVGAVGAALSHLALWERAPVTICEDDAILHSDFSARSQELLSRLASWDIVLWTWSLQSAVYFDIGVGCLTLCDFTSMRQNMQKFLSDHQNRNLYRLKKAFGAICYSISTRGASKLRASALPLRPLAVKVPLADQPIPNIGIDVVMCDQYEKLEAYVCFPPLAFTPQLHESTVQGTKPFIP